MTIRKEFDYMIMDAGDSEESMTVNLHADRLETQKEVFQFECKGSRESVF